MTHLSTHTNIAVLRERMRTDGGENAPAKQRGRPFAPGQSGNPAGRPKGARNRATMAAEALLEGEAEALTRKCIELALGGDTMALKLCLERLLPPRRDRSITFDLPEITQPDEIQNAVDALLVAVAQGAVTPAEAAVVMTLLDAKRRVMAEGLVSAQSGVSPVINITFATPVAAPAALTLCSGEPGGPTGGNPFFEAAGTKSPSK